MNRQDIENELRHHIEARAADLRLRGLTAAEAMRQARIEFGSIPNYMEATREARGWLWLDRLRGDVQVAARTLRRSPMFSLVAIATLSLGIGANALVFSIVNGVLLKPLPYHAPDRIYSIRTHVPRMAKLYPDIPVNGRHFSEWRKSCTSCEGLSLVGVRQFNLAGAGEPQRLEGLSVSAQLLPLLGVTPQLGRGFDDAEAQPGGARVAMISDALWRGTFGADPGAVGRKILLDQTPTEIIGVLPASFRMPRGEQMGAVLRMPDRVDVLAPVTQDLSKIRVGGNFNWGALVKLRPGVSIAQASSEMNRPLAAFAKEAQQEMQVRLLPLQLRMTEEARRPLWMLSVASATLLLIICVNLGNLMLARSAGRQREAAIRMAMGASRWDLFRHAIMESLLLAALGGASGLALAGVAARLLVRAAPTSLPRLEDIAVDWTVGIVSLALSALAAVLCAVAPVWRMWRGDPQQALASRSQRSTEAPAERRARQALVSFEAGLSMALAALAALLMVSFHRAMSVEKGFDVQRVLTFQLALPEGRYTQPRRNQFHAALLDRLNAAPGVAAAALTSHLPLQGEIWISQLRRKGDTRHFNDVPQGNWRFVSPDYLRVVGTPLRAGREFTASDRDRNVAILSERAAKITFPNENPLGQSIHYNDDGGAHLMEVIGIAADVKAAGLEADPPMMVYLPYWHLAPPGAAYVVRAAGDERQILGSVRAAVASVDRELPIFRVRTMTEIVETAAAPRRMQTMLAAAFALAGVLLACLGVFGVVSYGVSRRTGEIGVRMALGATRHQVMRMILGDSLRPVLLGLAGGLLCALAAGQWMASQLYGVGPRDPLVLGVVAASLTLASLSAAYWPARRASRIEPLRALRWD